MGNFMAAVGRANIPGRLAQAMEPVRAIQSYKAAKQTEEMNAIKIRQAKNVEAKMNETVNVGAHPFMMGLDPKTRDQFLGDLSKASNGRVSRLGVGSRRDVDQVIADLFQNEKLTDSWQKSIVTNGYIKLEGLRKKLDAAGLSKDPIKIQKAKEAYDAAEKLYSAQVAMLPNVRAAIAKTMASQKTDAQLKGTAKAKREGVLEANKAAEGVEGTKPPTVAEQEAAVLNKYMLGEETLTEQETRLIKKKFTGNETDPVEIKKGVTARIDAKFAEFETRHRRKPIGPEITQLISGVTDPLGIGMIGVKKALSTISNQFKTQFPPKKYKDRTIKDTSTGITFKSDGESWEPQL